MTTLELWFGDVENGAPILVSDPQGLKDAMLIRGVNIVLTDGCKK